MFMSGAVIMTRVISRVHPVHLTKSDKSKHLRNYVASSTSSWIGVTHVSLDDGHSAPSGRRVLTYTQCPDKREEHCFVHNCSTYHSNFWQATSWRYCKAIIITNVHIT